MVSIPITVDRQDDDVDVLVPVTIGGHGPYRFVLDTGASSTAVNPRVLKAVDAEDSGKRVEVSDASGAVQRQRLYWLDSWRAGGMRLQQDALVSRLDPDFDEDGLLGSDQLSRFGSVTIDHAHKRLLLTPRGR